MFYCLYFSGFVGKRPGSSKSLQAVSHVFIAKLTSLGKFQSSPVPVGRTFVVVGVKSIFGRLKCRFPFRFSAL